MNGQEVFQKPITGYVGMFLHKGGEYDIQRLRMTDDARIIRSTEFENLIVNTASTLMAQRLAPGNSSSVGSTPNYNDYIAYGLQYLAVGTGYEDTGQTGYSLQNPQPASVVYTQLRQELYRKQFTSWTFLDPNTGNAVTNPTNVLQLVTTFLENEAVGALVEMGLFGGNATSTANSGFLFNYKSFPVWNKPNDARLTITWKLTF